MRHIPVPESEIEDVTGSAGWMYTDLLVGLMAIFLATITFIPEGVRLVDPRAVQTYTEIYPTPLANKYAAYDYAKIKKDIDAFAEQEGFLGAESVARVQVVVSYDPSKETTGKAVARASEIANNLRKDGSYRFKEAVVVLQTLSDTGPNYFILEFTFNRFVQVLDTSQPAK